MSTRKRWLDLTAMQRLMTVVMGTIQIGLLVAAQRDISRRPEGEIRGNKRMWRAITLVNYVGPTLYFAYGVIR